MANCLVTGGAGFLGSHLTRALVGRGHWVRVLDNCSGTAAAAVAALAGVGVMHGDITCFDVVGEACRDIDYVFHCAALGTRLTDPADAIEIHRCCATGTLHVLEAARHARVRRVVYASTGHVYGTPSRSPVREEEPTNPLSPYAASKLAGEMHCVAFTRAYGLSTVRLRFFNLFGPGQPRASRYSQDFRRLLSAVSAGRRPPVPIDRWDCPDLLYVDDAAHAAILAAESDRLSGRVYNIARGRGTRARDLLAMLNYLQGSNLAPIQVRTRRETPLDFLADIAEAETELGYCPATGMLEALAECLADRAIQAEPLEEVEGTVGLTP